MSDFNSGHDLIVHGFEPRIGLCAGVAESMWDSLSPPPLSLPLPHLRALSLEINKLKEKYSNKIRKEKK